MANTVKYGSQGDDVKKLQQALNGAGYKLAVDGVFGNDTQQAVSAYQKANGLSADGIAGPQTWASLTRSGTGGAAAAAQTAANTTNPTPQAQTAAETPTATQPAAQTGFQYGGTPTFQQSAALSQALDALTGAVPGAWGYQPGQDVQEALAAVQSAAAEKPAAYQSRYSDTLDRLYEQAMERQPFSYDYSADPLYLAYKDRYTQNARQAMSDTMANAAALTGGYLNSYAAAAGQQAYDQQMNGLNDVLLTLYQQAYGRYQDENDDLMKQIDLVRGLDETEYSRWADQLADYYDTVALRRALAGDAYERDYGQYADQRADDYARLDALNTLANNMYSREYGEYADQLNQFNTDRAFDYSLYQDALAQELAAASGSGSGSRSGGSGGSGSSAGTSANYKTILATAKGMTNAKAFDYVGRMVDGGYITPAEGERILGVEMGLDMSQYAGSTGSSTGTGSTTSAAKTTSGAVATPNVVLSAALKGNEKAQSTLDKLYEAAGLGTAQPVGPVNTSMTDELKARLLKYR